MNELLTDFQLGGTGRGISTPAYGKYQSYSGSPVMTPYDRNQQQYYDPQHEDHQRNELNDTAPTPSSNYVPVSSTRNTTIPYNRTPPSQRNDNVDYLFSDKRASTGKKEVEFDLLLTPNQTNKLSQHGGGAIAGSVGASKGYYDGLLDIPVIPSASTRPAGITPYREEKTSLRSPGKKPVYSWSLPGFGLEDESGVPSTTPSAAVK